MTKQFHDLTIFLRKQRRMMEAAATPAAPSFTNVSNGRISANTQYWSVAGDPTSWLGLGASDPRSFSYWIYCHDASWKTNTFHFCVGNTGGGAGSRFNSLMFGARDSTSNQLAGRIPISADGSGQDWIWTSAPSVGAWHHFLVVVDFAQAQANRMRLYVDGVLVTTASAGSPNTAFLASTQPFAIGSNSVGQTLRTINDAGIDEFAIYGAALTVADAVEQYNGGTPLDLQTLDSASDLITYWRFGDTDGDSATTVQDIVGGHDLTGVGSPTLEESAP